ncbi:hypothetical protein ACIPJU_06350 [Micrococcus endophyticus]
MTPRPDAPRPAGPRVRSAVRAVLAALAVMAALFVVVVLLLAYGAAR